MLVSHPKKFIYIKTVKTAGTSIEVALQENCVAPDFEFSGIKTGAIESDFGIVGARGSGVTGEKWYNHMPALKIRDNLPEEVWEGYFKFCNIRNPWDKTVSWFHFKHPEIKKNGEDEIVQAFRSWLDGQAGRDIGRDTSIYFIDGTPVCDDYIRYETLADDYHRICEKLGLREHPVPKLKTLQRGKAIAYQKYYDAALRDSIGELYSQEIARFGWSF